MISDKLFKKILIIIIVIMSDNSDYNRKKLNTLMNVMIQFWLQKLQVWNSPEKSCHDQRWDFWSYYY